MVSAFGCGDLTPKGDLSKLFAVISFIKLVFRTDRKAKQNFQTLFLFWKVIQNDEAPKGTINLSLE